jgi:hypothetical protein
MMTATPGDWHPGSLDGHPVSLMTLPYAAADATAAARDLLPPRAGLLALEADVIVARDALGGQEVVFGRGPLADLRQGRLGSANRLRVLTVEVAGAADALHPLGRWVEALRGLDKAG